jgi:nitrogen PTS system EIIA component
MTLTEFTAPGLIVPQLRSRDVAGVIQELSQALLRERRVPDLLMFYHAALNRELLVSTDTEAGMAFPHARLAGLEELSFAFGRAAHPLAWRAGAGESVRFVFLIAVPATESAQYLQLISGLVRLAKDADAMQSLGTVPDVKQLFHILSQVGVRHMAAPSARGTGGLA